MELCGPLRYRGRRLFRIHLERSPTSACGGGGRGGAQVDSSLGQAAGSHDQRLHLWLWIGLGSWVNEGHSSGPPHQADVSPGGLELPEVTRVKVTPGTQSQPVRFPTRTGWVGRPSETGRAWRQFLHQLRSSCHHSLVRSMFCFS